ncbi:CUN036 hypothetical protein [Culex nigripalpus nucleopolyhedrovirus]|uniref:Uncharacterized protein n=1 Tax=Culex nigripalpus nucleopolyhedrovirus (isolate Florida/1997) TaxID=645993 RepID=Q919N3_NPVCO|nr:CUN036 hypothetical protein [Culex nigripalpus nucleopolyhedrovirus]AAK94114.1 CUN036 hypothetical protein [Culex nigripalpus nucleopolyhedrovirus]
MLWRLTYPPRPNSNEALTISTLSPTSLSCTKRFTFALDPANAAEISTGRTRYVKEFHPKFIFYLDQLEAQVVPLNRELNHHLLLEVYRLEALPEQFIVRNGVQVVLLVVERHDIGRAFIWMVTGSLNPADRISEPSCSVVMGTVQVRPIYMRIGGGLVPKVFAQALVNFHPLPLDQNGHHLLANDLRRTNYGMLPCLGTVTLTNNPSSTSTT